MSGQEAGEPRVQPGIEAEIDAVLAEFGGDARLAIGALLHDLAVLAADAASSTSRGYVRGRIGPARLRARIPQGCKEQ